MRLAIDLAAAVNQRAGIGRYARGILSALAERVPHDWVFELSPRPNSSAYEGTLPRFAHSQRLILPVSERYLWIAWHRLRLPLPPDLLARRLDIFYNPDFLLPPLARTPGVPTIHDLGFITVPECAFPSLRQHLLRAVPHTLLRARFIMAVSEATKRDLISLLDVPAERIRIAGNAPAALFRPIPDEEWRVAERARLDLPARFLLAVGTLEPRKNLVRLLEALALLRDRGTTISLVVAGREGWLFEPIYEAVERLRLREQVRFVYGPSDQTLLSLYNLCEVMVFPSLYEGFGLPPLEALACGSVVVSSNSSSLPEVLGDAALLVDPYDSEALAVAVEQALDDHELRCTLASRGPAQAARFTWPSAAQSVYETLREAAR